MWVRLIDKVGEEDSLLPDISIEYNIAEAYLGPF